jgi:hypothetical protein
MSHEDYVEELLRITDAANKGGRLVYWNMLADRKPSGQITGQLPIITGWADDDHYLEEILY